MSERPSTAPAGSSPHACPECGCRHHRTLETRAGKAGSIRRRRECRYCGRRFTTYEKPI